MATVKKIISRVTSKQPKQPPLAKQPKIVKGVIKKSGTSKGKSCGK